MWCYQKPGFEALLLAELQRQQQCSQFCDTLLKTEGVSVPAHSCILSAISPHISSALSSAPSPPAGQTRLLEFRALGACTLLHMVRLLYTGEMAGEGEKEKQEAISAAANLGICGLVEVTRRDPKSRREEEKEEGQHAEVGVQTEPPVPEENEGRRRGWRREVRDGSTFLWKETVSGGERDTWTQTEELQVNAAPLPPHPAASFETIDISALQSLGQTDPSLLPSQVPCVPVSLVYPLEENQTHHFSSAHMDPMQESTAAGHTSVVVQPYAPAPPPLSSFSGLPNLCVADPQQAARGVAAAEEWEDDRFEQFQGNIPGYINYFLNSDKEKGSRRGRPRGSRGSGARRAGTDARRARRPRARTGGRGRGGFMQTVDVQDVGVSRLQNLFLQRWGIRTSRTGQGGGAAGRKLYLKTRELLIKDKRCHKRRTCSKAWEFSPSRGTGNMRSGWRNTTQQFHQDDVPAGRPRRARAKPTASSPSRRPSLSPAAPYVSPAPFPLRHPTSVPPPAASPHAEQPEQIDRLLEEVIMGLNILPSSNSGDPHFQPLLPVSHSSCTCVSSGNSFAQNKQQGQVVIEAKGVGSSSPANTDMPALQQQADGELNAMLEHFLLSFERHIDSCTAREEVGMDGDSCTEAPVGSSQITEPQQNDKAETPLKASAIPRKHTEGRPEKVKASNKRRKRRRKKQYMLALEKKRVRNPASSSDAKTKTVHDQVDKQLQQRPVVKLERSGLLPVRVTLQGRSCQILDVKGLAKTSSSSVKCPRDSSSGKNQSFWWSTKTYPIRSRFKEAQVDSIPFLEEPLVQKLPRAAGQPRARPRKNGQHLSLSDGESSAPPIQPQPVEPCGTDEQLEKNQERHEQDLTVQPQEEADGPTMSLKRRGAETEERTSDSVSVAKRACFEQMPQLTSETCTPSSDPAHLKPAAIEMEDTIDVEAVSVTSGGECLEREVQKTAWSEIVETKECLMDEETESSCDDLIDVDGDDEDDCQKDAVKDTRRSRTGRTHGDLVKVKPSVSLHSDSEASLGSTGGSEEDKDEDVDVIGGCSPVPGPVIIDWMESSDFEKEEEDEDVDVVGENTECASSAVFAAMGKENIGELVSFSRELQDR
nr:uncharacterized protein LOC124068577 isoform X2 [Scatophagus argus]